MNPFKAVKEFHEKYNQAIDKEFDEETIRLRVQLLNEEINEFTEELFEFKEIEEGPLKGALEWANIENINRENLTKELADIIYVAIGAAVTWGLPLEEVFKRVHEANMTKDGGFSETGKVLKGDGYKKEVLGDLFE